MRKISYLVGLLNKPQRRALRWFALLCLLSPAADLFSVSMMISVFEQAFGGEVPAQLVVNVLFVAFMLLLVGLLELLRSRVSVSLAAGISQNWSVKIYELYGMEELEDHNRKTPMQAINGARNDPSVCASIIVTFIGLLADGLTIAVYAAVLVYVSRIVGAVSALVMALVILLLYLGKRLHMTQYGERKRYLEIRTGGMVSTSFGSYKEIKIDSRKGNMLERYRRVSGDCAKVQKEYSFMLSLQGIVLQHMMQAGLFLALAVLLAADVALPEVLPQAMVYITLLFRMIPAAKKIVSSLTDMRYGTRYFEAFKQDMDRYAQLKEAEGKREKLRKKQPTLAEGIRVRNLSFHYPGGRQIFEDLSVDIPVGHSIAIIGPSGEGKTTFLDLLLGLLHPQSGHIWYDDFDIVDEADGEGPCWAEIGAVVSYIPQTVYLDNETLYNNVVFMAEDRNQNKEKVIECLKCAQIWEDVQRMPDGINTLIGQNGTTVSGGQRQRIALARALYKDFEILVMDEATAALDMETEKAVIDSIRQMKKDKTLLMVTHHMNLADECEYIYKLENGKLARIR
ncbi:MAG: ABC transporter ATP-binding protein [Oscillospiraceae bacterium]|nr:ABC transporter ATP-binding protein [Oscillospiraceae bacterium]